MNFEPRKLFVPSTVVLLAIGTLAGCSRGEASIDESASETQAPIEAKALPDANTPEDFRARPSAPEDYFYYGVDVYESRPYQDSSIVPDEASVTDDTDLEQTETPEPKPTEQTKTQSNNEVDCSIENCVAFTFDDGPGPVENDKRLSELFNDIGGAATFFVVGDRITGNSEWKKSAQYLVDNGMQVAPHSVKHDDLTLQTIKSARNDIATSRAIIQEELGVDTNIFRFPYGAYTPELNDVLGELGMVNVAWGVNHNDWDSKVKADPDKLTKDIVNDIIQAIESGEDPIYLAHSIHKNTIDVMEFAIPRLVDAVDSDGEPYDIKFVTIDQMFGGQIYDLAGKVICEFPYDPDIEDCYKTQTDQSN